MSAVRKLVLDGVGIHLGPKWVFKNDIESGAVVQLFTEKPLKSFPVHSLYIARSYLPLKTKEFSRLLSEYLDAEI